jgi:hypothetical protein
VLRYFRREELREARKDRTAQNQNPHLPTLTSKLMMFSA